jgi:dolichol-phosphate mannosyltransferase
MARVSVVIPIYRSEAIIEELYRRLRAALESITPDFEILLVEDCGGDRSWELICDLARRDPRVKGLQFSRNFGQHYGITAGLDHCDGDWVVVMDGDLQDRPEDIPALYARAQEGYDVVVARRGIRLHSPLKRFASWAFYRLFSWLSDIEYDGETGNFRIVSRRVVENVRRMREQMRFFGGLLAWMGFPTALVDVQQDPRFAGRSSYSLRRLSRLAVDVIIAYSDKPLRLAIRLGFYMALFAFLFGLFFIYRALFHAFPVLGYPSIMVSIYFVGGIIIAILGILGIYLGKTYDETKRRPLYVVMRSTFEGDRAGGGDTPR